MSETDESTPETPPTSPPQPGNPAGWSYSDYLLQPTPSQIRQRLRSHVQEVADRLAGFAQRTGGDGWSYTRFSSLGDYLKNLKVELKDMETGMDRPRKPRFVALR